MYIKVFPHGQGTGSGPVDYLLRMDYPGRSDSPPTLLRGDADMTRDIIDAQNRKWKFSAGVCSWGPEDTVTPQQEQQLMDDFEHLAFAGLEHDQYNILWVRHSHAGHHELHFVIPRIELSTGRLTMLSRRDGKKTSINCATSTTGVKTGRAPTTRPAPVSTRPITPTCTKPGSYAGANRQSRTTGPTPKRPSTITSKP